MPTKWLQERAKGSKNEHGMPPHRVCCGLTGVRSSRWNAGSEQPSVASSHRPSAWAAESEHPLCLQGLQARCSFPESSSSPCKTKSTYLRECHRDHWFKLLLLHVLKYECTLAPLPDTNPTFSKKFRVDASSQASRDMLICPRNFLQAYWHAHTAHADMQHPSDITTSPIKWQLPTSLHSQYEQPSSFACTWYAQIWSNTRLSELTQ